LRCIASARKAHRTSLTLAIVAIHGWNRLSIAFRMAPTYERN
jgi:hypothetical protein